MHLAKLVCKSIFLHSINEHLETAILKLPPQSMKRNIAKICTRSACETKTLITKIEDLL